MRTIHRRTSTHRTHAEASRLSTHICALRVPGAKAGSLTISGAGDFFEDFEVLLAFVFGGFLAR